MNYSLPKRIVCLTEETTEILYELGMSHLIVGISKYTLRPPQAKIEKPIIARYIDANIDEIINLKPDLVVAWSDLQAPIASELIKAGIEVYCFNQRSIDGIFSNILRLSTLIGNYEGGIQLIDKLKYFLDNAFNLSKSINSKPKIYFEEWFNPLITGIEWVVEIIELCGGIDILPEYSKHPDAKSRIVADPNIIVERNPDIIIASWCGKKFYKKKLVNRENWNKISAVQNDYIYEIPSEIILQPGPASLSDGVKIISNIIQKYSQGNK